MTEPDTPRPVSGEIMAGGARTGPSRAAPKDFTDAEYEVALAGDPAEAPRGAASPPPPEGMDSLKAAPGAPARRGAGERGGIGFWAAGAVIVFAAFWVSGGHALIRQMPSGEVRQAGAGLELGQVDSRVERHGGRGVLFVEGEVVNRGSSPLTVPPLSIAVSETEGPTTTYHLETGGTVLAPGERYVFSSRLHAPDKGVRLVTVRFREAT